MNKLLIVSIGVVVGFSLIGYIAESIYQLCYGEWFTTDNPSLIDRILDKAYDFIRR